jgi:hypothetical protein
MTKQPPSHPGYNAQAAPRYEKNLKERERWRKWHKETALGYIKERPDLIPLWNILLQAGGYAVVPTFESDLRRLLDPDRGILMDGREAVFVKGAPIRCHENAAVRWDEGKGRVRIMTGYALSPDGLWRQHSWNLDSRYVSIESTVKRKLYYGFILTDKESEIFYDDNVF